MTEKLKLEPLHLAEAIQLVINNNIDRLEGIVADDLGRERTVRIYWDDNKGFHVAEIEEE